MGIRVAIPPFDTPPQAEQLLDLSVKPPMDLMDETCAQTFADKVFPLEPQKWTKELLVKTS